MRNRLTFAPISPFWDEIGAGSALVDGDGVRVALDELDRRKLKRLPTAKDKRRAVADLIRRQPVGSRIPIWQHAIDSRVPPPLAEETTLVLQHSKKDVLAEDVAAKWHRGVLTQEQYLDKLLVILWDALFFAQCRRWALTAARHRHAQAVSERSRRSTSHPWR